VTVVRNVLQTADAAGIPVNGFEDLQSTAVLDALDARLVREGNTKPKRRLRVEPKGNAIPLPATWGGVYLCGNLRALRTILHASGLDASADLNSRIAFYATAEPRSVDHRLFKKETYLAGAAALAAFGRIALACGHVSGQSIRTGARLLAVVVDGSPRRSEMGLADRTLVRDNPLSATPEVKVFVRRETSKPRRTRTLYITDPRAIRLLSELRKGPGDHELFRTPDGTPIGLPRLDAILRRFSTMAVGQPANYNILRRANAEARATTAGRAAILAHADGSLVTDSTYHRTLTQKGVSGLAAARARARAAAERALASPLIDEDEESGG